jgi:peptidoglycan/LPS O-acetylase OafA/YrhL
MSATINAGAVEAAAMQHVARRRLVSLEVARFAAAFCVCTDHAVSFVAGGNARPVLHGFDLPPIIAVLFFFVLSGFVIAQAHADDLGDKRAIPRYLWRRFCRIYPLYWLSLVVPLMFLWRVSPPGYLLRIATLSPFYGNLPELVPPAWSLRFEIAFYLMFALVLLPRVGKPILALWIGLAVLNWYPWLLPMARVHIGNYVPGPIAWRVFGTHDLLFFSGLAAGFGFVKFQPPARSLWAALLLSTLALIALTALDQGGFAYPPVNRVPLLGASLAGAIFCLAALERGGHLTLPGPLNALGALSYPLYLFHPAVIFLGSVWFYYHPDARPRLGDVTMLLATLAGSLGAAAIVSMAFDRPVQGWVRKRYFFEGSRP